MKSKAIFGLLALSVVAFGMAALTARSANATSNNPKDVTICHRNNSVTNRYSRNSVDVKSIDGEKKNDHSHHTGPVAYNEARATALKDGDSSTDEDKTKWGDIIPPFRNDGNPTGQAALNWDEIGQAVWYAGCGEPLAASASVSVAPATCDTGARLVYGEILNASFSGTANGTTGLGSYSVTATAAQNALFYYVTPPVAAQDFTGNLEGPTGIYQSTNPEAECYKAPTPEPEVKKADITATAVCATVDDKAVVQVTLVNKGKAAGTVTVNGKNVEVAAGATVVENYDYPANAHIVVKIGDRVPVDKTLSCTPGQGGGGTTPETPKTPETPETPKTTEAPETPKTPEAPESPKSPESPIVLPNTFGASTPLVASGALSFASLILVAGTAIKSRLLA